MSNFCKKYKTKIIIATLSLTTIIFAVLFIQEKINHPENQIKKYPFINTSRHLISQKDFFSTVNPLRVDLRNTVQEYEKQGYKIGLYFEYLNTGGNISINPDMRFWPASLSKMPTAFVVMKKVQDGEWKLSDELVLFEEDKDSRFGTLHKDVVGTRYTIETLLKKLLIESDNTAHKILIRNLSSAEFDSAIEALGMEQLFDENYDITAKEYSRIFSALYNASYLDREHSQILLKWLSETPFTDFLDSGAPENVSFSHKIGEEFEKSVFLDSGIVYVENRPYLITLMVDTSVGGGVEKAKEIMKVISEKIYNYVATN